MRRILGCAATVLVVLAWGEFVCWRASVRGVRPSSAATEGGTEAVVVLGYRNVGDRANAVNRWRVRAALRSRGGGRSRLVFCGGPVAGPTSEAELMARYARDVHGYGGEFVLEPHSRSTWENIANAVPLIEDADRIKIVSHAPHAEKAREYLRRQRPDLAARLVRAGDYLFGETPLVTLPVVVLAVRHQLGTVGRRTRGGRRR